MKWRMIEKGEKLKNPSWFGAILRTVFGKTALPAISIFPQGIASKPHKGRMALTGQSELMGDNFILGVAVNDGYDEVEGDELKDDKLEDGEIMVFSEDADKNKFARIILKSDGKIMIYNETGDKEKKAKIVLKKSGDIEISGGNEKSKITLKQDGNIEVSGEKIKLDAGNIDVSSQDIVLNAKNAIIKCSEKAEISAKKVEINGESTLEI
jgi:hypothetical protein